MNIGKQRDLLGSANGMLELIEFAEKTIAECIDDVLH